MRSLLLFLGLAALYVVSAPALEHQHWDSLEYPHACETRAPKTIWGNHPLGHVALCGAYRLAASLGYDGRALPFMSVVNAFVGATTIVVFVWLLAEVRVPRRTAIGWGLVMGGTYGFWLYAGTADIYGLSLLAMLLAWIALLRHAAAPSPRRGLVAGVVVGIAVVTHQFNGPLLLAAFAVLFARPPDGARRPRVAEVAAIGGVSVAIVAAGYWTLGLVANGTSDWEVFRRWVVDYGADPTYGRSFNFIGLLKAMWTAGDTLLRMSWVPVVAVLRFWLLACLVAALVAGLAAAPFASGLLRAAAFSAAAQLAVGVPLIWWWAPDHVGKWWLLMLPAFVLLQATGTEVLGTRLASRPDATGAARASRRVVAAVPWALAIGCLAFTGLVTMRAMHDRDPAFEETMASWARHTAPQDVTLESDVTAHLLFWTKRPNALFIYRTIQASPASDRFARLREIVNEALEQGRSVFYVPGMVAGFQEGDLNLVGVTRDDVNRFFDQYDRIGPVFTYRPRTGAEERQVFRLQVKRK